MENIRDGKIIIEKYSDNENWNAKSKHTQLSLRKINASYKDTLKISTFKKDEENEIQQKYGNKNDNYYSILR